MTRPVRSWTTVPMGDEWHRPLYARALGLRFVNPGGVLCFLFFEGAVALAVLLALAELVSWWAVLVLPTVVAAMVKLNDLVAEVVIRSAAQVPEQERDRFRRQVEPVVGRASVPATARALPGVAFAVDTAGWATPPGDPAVWTTTRPGDPAVWTTTRPGDPPLSPEGERPDGRGDSYR
ncbi:hypothetical protein [Micromonospora sp. NPDC093277]|uniref:hypothetical protein n=1 Tax=Micromonospora sp. NPDC093277 TaxID=3364291 RepID=UPI00380F4587